MKTEDIKRILTIPGATLEISIKRFSYSFEETYIITVVHSNYGAITLSNYGEKNTFIIVPEENGLKAYIKGLGEDYAHQNIPWNKVKCRWAIYPGQKHLAA